MVTTLKDIHTFVLKNLPFAYDEMKSMSADAGSISLALMQKLGLNNKGASTNCNESAIADILYQQYVEENTVESDGMPVPKAEFRIGQTVYYMANEQIVNAKISTVYYTESVDPHIKSGFEYSAEFGPLPEKLFSSKRELVQDLLGDISNNLCSEVFLYLY